MDGDETAGGNVTKFLKSKQKGALIKMLIAVEIGDRKQRELEAIQKHNSALAVEKAKALEALDEALVAGGDFDELSQSSVCAAALNCASAPTSTKDPKDTPDSQKQLSQVLGDCLRQNHLLSRAAVRATLVAQAGRTILGTTFSNYF